MILIWHGTACIELRAACGRLLLDPFVPLKHAQVPVRLADFDGFPDILVTHGHLDHIAHLPKVMRRNPATRIHCTEAPTKTLLKKGVPEVNLQLIIPDETLEVNGFRVQALPGCHAVLPAITPARIAGALRSPARGNLPWIALENRLCREQDETVFYHIEADGVSVSLMGSLNLREYITYPTGADVLILPYNGWEDNFPPAVRVLDRLRPKRVLLDHYDDTFPPVSSAVPDLSPILNELRSRGIPAAPLRWNEPVTL